MLADYPSLDAQQPTIVGAAGMPVLLRDMAELGDFRHARGPEGRALRERLGHILGGA